VLAVIRLIDTVKLVRYLRKAQPEVQVSGRLLNWLERQPRNPDLIAGMVAARLLGVHGPHVARLVKQGRLRPVEVDGGANTYVRDEVLVLARELSSERAQRAAQRGEH
jgi:hypothetical protein